MSGDLPEGMRVVILTTFERDDYIFQALSAGASGFLLKNASPEDLIDAVRTVAKGDALLAPSVTRKVIEGFVSRPRSPSRQDEVAKQLVLGEATVKTHVSNLLGKLDLRDRVQAVVFAYETGLAQPGEE